MTPVPARAKKEVDREKLDRLASSFALFSSGRFEDPLERRIAYDLEKRQIAAGIESEVCREFPEYDPARGREDGIESDYTLEQIALLFVPIGELAVGVKALARPLGRLAGKISEKLVAPVWERIAFRVGLGVKTPYGIAAQRLTPGALRMRATVQQGSAIYRQGNFGKHFAEHGQFWALESPAGAASFAQKYGTAGTNAVDWMIKAQVKGGGQAILRQAPALGKNVGGALEAVTPSQGVTIQWFHMP